MAKLVTNLPRWLRIVLVGVATAAVLGGGWFVYRHFAKPVFLTVATGSSDGEAQLLISAISARLTASGAHVRLKVVNAGTSAGASEMLVGGRADLAVVRGDTGGLSDARSVLLLTHGVVLIMAPSAGSADSLGDLRNTTIGVISGDANGEVVEALKQVYPFDRAKVSFQNVAIGEAAAALSSRKVHALLAVVPLTEKYLAKVREFFQQNGGKGSAPKLIEIESAGAVANVAQSYESYDIQRELCAERRRCRQMILRRCESFLSCRQQIGRCRHDHRPDAIAGRRSQGFAVPVSDFGASRRSQHGCRCAHTDPSGSRRVLQRQPAKLPR
ncbi:hypothetical protein ACTGJ9_017245 [Bradyrhizobium sp. RDM12]